jgi:outer membrane protein assembly factor BamB
VSDPAISTQGVHVTAGYTTLTTRRLGDGAERWSVSVPGDPNTPSVLPGPVSVRDDTIFVPISNYKNFTPGSGVHAYDIRTGAGGDIVAPEAVGGVTVSAAILASTFKGCVPGICVARLDVTDLSDPSRNWNTLLNFNDTGVRATTTAVGNDRIIVGQGSQVDAFSVAKPTGCSTQNGPSFCPPLWTRALGGSPTVPILSDHASTVYVGTSAGGVWALDARDGSVLWRADIAGGGARQIQAPPTLGGGRLYVTTSDGTLFAFDANGCGAPTCPPTWAASTASPITKQAALAGGVLYIGSEDGSIDAYRADGCGAGLCAPLWRTSTGSPITGAPAVALGSLVVGTADGRLIAYRAP